MNKRSLLNFTIVSLVLFSSCAYEKEPLPVVIADPTFADVAKIFKSRGCTFCHNGTTSSTSPSTLGVKASVYNDVFTKWIEEDRLEPGNILTSSLYQSLNPGGVGFKANFDMLDKFPTSKITKSEIELINTWLKNGAHEFAQ